MADDRPPTKAPRNVAYYFDEEMCNYNYGGGNPMRPHRHRLTTNLVKGYELDKKMRIVRPEARTREEIMHFHADGAPRDGLGALRRRPPPLAAARPPPPAACCHGARPCCARLPAYPPPLPPADYVDFLTSVTPENQEEFMMQMRRFNLGPVGEADCPVFDGMMEYFQVGAYCGS